jgi:formate-dependent nitrite reductase membrane component NrfD
METNADLLLTIGIVLLVLSVPSLLSAWAESRAPRMGALMAITSLGMIVAALLYNPGGYAFNQIPGVMVRVVGGFFE